MHSHQKLRFSATHEVPVINIEAMRTNYKVNSSFSITSAKTKGGFFWRNGIDDILAQKNCNGLGYYFVFESGILKVILLGIRKTTWEDIMDGIISGNALTPFINGVAVSPADHRIAPHRAAALMTSYKVQFPKQAKGGFFMRNILDDMLAVSNVIGLEYEFGINAYDELHIILNPIDQSFNEVPVYNSANQRILCEASNGGGRFA